MTPEQLTFFERIHRAGAERHGLMWFNANAKAAECILGNQLPIDEKHKTLVSQVVLRVLDFVDVESLRERISEDDKRISALQSALDEAQKSIEKAPHYCTPSDNWRCQIYNANPCNCWKSAALSRIAALKEPK